MSNVNQFFKIIAQLDSVWNLLQNPYDITHLTLGMLLHYLEKLKMQIFCRYSAHMEENANKLHFYRIYLCYSSTNFDIFSEFFPILIANKNFHVTVVLLVYFCDQSVAPEIRHSRRHSSVCQQSTWYSVTRTRFSIKALKYAQHTQLNAERN